MAQRSILDLTTPEQFLLSALRLWGQGRSDHADVERGTCCCRSLLRNGFHAAGLLATEFETFDRVLTLIDTASSNRRMFELPQEPCVSRTEERYLRALAFAQSGALTQLNWALRVWLPQTAVRHAMRDLTVFARSCAAVGLVLSVPDKNHIDDDRSDDDHSDDDHNEAALATLNVIPLRNLSAQLH